MWTCKRVILFSESVNILFFSVDMDNEIETLIQTHMYRHGHLVCQACFKSCEKRFLKRDNFQKITDIKKFCNYAEKWEKKTHTFNTVKSHVSWESLNNTTEI